MKSLDNMSPRERGLLFLGVVVILCFLGDYVVARKITERFEQMDADIVNKRLELTFNQKMLAREDQIIDQWAKAEPFVPPRSELETQDLRELQSLLNTIRKDAGAQLGNMKPLETEGHSYHYDYQVQLDVQGDREAVFNLIHRVENAHSMYGDTGLLRVKKLSVKPVDAGESGVLKATMIVSEIVAR